MEEVSGVDKPQEKITGGNVNYYLINVKDPKNLSPYVVEVEDIIEVLNMEFAEGTVFKSLIRLCKLRQNLGKPGSTQKYEAEKIKYYADRILVKAKRRANKPDQENEDTNCCLIKVPDPKRLPPYVVEVEDIIKVLDMGLDETEIFKNLIQLCMLKSTKTHEAEQIKYHADKLLNKF